MTFLNALLAALFTFVELNCENLFDYQHDEGKNDYEYLPTSDRRWDVNRYWRKVNAIAQEIVACGGEEEWVLPDMVALCEVENDSVLRDLTRRSLLRSARYEYIMTESDDERGIDVALLYSPFSFQLICYDTMRVEPVENSHATRDILYAEGLTIGGDTLHVFVVHAPSRVGGAAHKAYRDKVANRITMAVDSLRQCHDNPDIIIAGDFNDYADDHAPVFLRSHDLVHISKDAQGSHGAKGTYKFQGKWGSLDHIFVSPSMAGRLEDCFIFDAPFLLSDDKKYGGKQPKRTYVGKRHQRGFSDHLPLVARFHM